MGQEDKAEKLLEDYNDVFADIFNVLVFNGSKRILPDALEESSLRSQYKADDSRLHEQERDIMKYWTEGAVKLAICGIENQTKSDRQMPLRIIGYEGANYRSQYKQKHIAPVITLILYFGTKMKWNGPENITELFDIPEGLEQYVNDYHINIVNVAWLTEEQISMFDSDFRIIANFFVQKRKDPGYIPKDETVIRHVDEFLKFMAIMAQDKNYEELIYNPNFKKEGASMCSVAQNLISIGRKEGIAKGIEKGIEKGRANDIENMLRAGRTPEQISDFCGFDLEEVKTVQKDMLVTV